jgi:hypothetical protein
MHNVRRTLQAGLKDPFSTAPGSSKWGEAE